MNHGKNIKKYHTLKANELLNAERHYYSTVDVYAFMED